MHEDPTLQNRGTLIGGGTDKTGLDIEIYWATDIEGPNRGFVSHRATAWAGDEYFGFVRVGYVDTQAYAHRTPTIWNYAASFDGLGAGYFPFWGQDEVKAPLDLPETKRIAYQQHMLSRAGCKDPERVRSFAEFEAEMLPTRVFKRMVADQGEMLETFENIPVVGYAQTCDITRRISHAGRGIGKILYAGAAHALKDMGLSLYGSTVQDKSAIGLWDRLVDLGWAETMLVGGKVRPRLNPDLVPSSVFVPSAPTPDAPSF